MNKILVTYDLIGGEPIDSYKKIYNYLSKFDAIKPLESVWILKTSKEADVIRDEIGKLIDSDDKLFVCKYVASARKWLTAQQSQRLKS